MSREDKLFQMCTTLPFPEEKDPRDENSIPELSQVAELRDTGQAQEAINYGKTLMKMYPNNDLIPFMLAYIYYQRNFPEEALKLAVDAIPRCPRKYRLYSVAGLAEFDRDRLPEACVWWCRSVIAQCKVTDFQEYDSFLHLAHLAEILRLKDEAQMFFAMTDAIEPSEIRLSEEELARLKAVKRSWAKAPLKRAITHIEQQYLHE